MGCNDLDWVLGARKSKTPDKTTVVRRIVQKWNVIKCDRINMICWVGWVTRKTEIFWLLAFTFAIQSWTLHSGAVFKSFSNQLDSEGAVV